MSDMNQLLKELKTIIADTATPINRRASQIIDDVMMRYADIFDVDPNAQALSDLATKITTSGATEGENGIWWGEVVRVIHVMCDK